MRILHVPVLEDNYAYLIVDDENGVTAAVDPAEPRKVLEAAHAAGVPPISIILTTHHHWDHANGNAEMVSKLGGAVEVVGGDDRIQALTRKVGDGDVVMVGSIAVKVFFTPCHTTGHVLYYIEQSGEDAPALFSGDTLFIGGCGRFFEGTAEQMYHALCEVVASLPDNTRLYCGHEYTVSNLTFALKVEPDNEVLNKKFIWAKQQREQSLPTIPTTIGEEKLFNPFMRVDTATVKRAVGLGGGASGIEVMAAVRSAKNRGRL